MVENQTKGGLRNHFVLFWYFNTNTVNVYVEATTRYNICYTLRRGLGSQ